MPRAIPPDATLDTIEDEVLFTDAALKVDPDAADLTASMDGWLTQVDALRLDERAVRQSHQEGSARRAVTNSRLDVACVRFGDDLYLATGKDRSAQRWLGFFPVAVSAFVRLPFADQVQKVTGWLTSTDAALDPHRDALSTWTTAGSAALAADAALRITRSAHWQRRAAFTTALTEARDILHDQLSDIARARGLGRAWADAFFARG